MYYSLYSSVMLAVAIAMACLSVHMLGDRTLQRSSRRWFAVASLIIAGNALIECLGANNTLLRGYPTLFTILFVLEIAGTPFICPAQCYACEMPRLAKPALIACAAYAVAVPVLFLSGELFTMTAEAGYVAGRCSFIIAVFSLIHSTYSLVMLVFLKRKYKGRSLHSLFLIGGMFFLSSLGSLLTGFDCISVLGGAFSFFLLYVFYTSLCRDLLTENIRNDEERMEELSLQTMKSLADAIDAKDRYTNGHSHRVAEYSVILAQKLGWDEHRLKYLRYAGLMHDIGKIGIPDSVLNKDARLTDIEFGMMKAHTVFGSDIAQGVSSIPEAYDAARSHHERYDGKGYPNGLSGKEIPEIARIIAVADTFDAMNSDRIYRRALPKEVIVRELLKGSGTQFDPEFVKVFVEIYESGALDAIAASGRQDMVEKVVLDDFTSFVADLLEFFRVKYELLGEWDERFTQWGRMNRYIQEQTKNDNRQADFDMAVITIRPADGRTVEEALQQKAINTMIGSVKSYTQENEICAQISKTQIAVIFRWDSGLEPRTSMQQIFIYFYKIFESGAFIIDYRIIDPDEKDEEKAAP